MRARCIVALPALVILTSLFSPAVSAQGTPVNDLRAQAAGNSIALTWTHRDATFVRYELWRGNRPYAMPGEAGMVKLATVEPGPLDTEVTCPDTFTGIGSVTLNVFYAVRGVNASNQVSTFSNQVGEFDYQVSGAGSTTASSCWSSPSTRLLTPMRRSIGTATWTRPTPA